MLVYKAELPNGKMYIGCTSADKLAHRIRGHKHKALKTDIQLPFYRAIRKYGWNSIKWDVIFETDSHQELLQKEIELIKRFDCKVPNGYNVTDGGEGTLGLTSWSKGKKFSKKHRDNMRKSSIKKKTVVINLQNGSYEILDSVSDVSKKYNIDYPIAKIARTNNRRWFQYRIVKFEDFDINNKELFQDLPSANAKRITLKHINGEVKEFQSMSSAYKQLNITERQMRNIVHKQKQYKGWKLCQNL